MDGKGIAADIKNAFQARVLMENLIQEPNESDFRKFIARQPIFDARENVYGYELLFRSGLDNYFKCTDPDYASSRVIVDSFLLFGLETLISSHRAFINFTRDLILRKYATLLPKQQLVIEILENIEPDEELIAACKELKQQGYRIALDDFIFEPKFIPLFDFVDLVKIDILQVPVDASKDLARHLMSKGIELLAEKVETREQFKAAKAIGYKYFQGYFFGQPEVLSTREIQGSKLNYLWLIQAINEQDPNFIKIEEVIKREPTLTFKLLRYLNSTIFGFSKQIQSIRHALALLGLTEVRKLISIVSLSAMGSDKPPILLSTLISRAKFCESIAPSISMSDRALDLFLMGLLSMIDTVLNTPLPDVLRQLAVSDEVKAALLQSDGLLRPVFDLAIAAEKGQWTEVSRLSSSLSMHEDAVIEIYLNSVQWGNQIVGMDANPLG
jgi:EAL and modified HD-GYP domain-containing signal transduction protein